LEAANYLRISVGTLRSWVNGRYYPTASGRKFFEPLVRIAAPGFLSFYNLVEVHILLSTRKKYKIEMPVIREAIDYISKEFPSEHPLLTEKFLTDGKDLFVRKLEQTINVSKRGQLGIGPILDMYLKRIERDRIGLPLVLYPVRRDWEGQPDEEPPKVVVINPKVSSGRPVVHGTGIATTILYGRFRAGEGTEELARDYGLRLGQIDEVIRYATAA
jgi:uncharacterized protein (DUF433 family)